MIKDYLKRKRLDEEIAIIQQISPVSTSSEKFKLTINSNVVSAT